MIYVLFHDYTRVQHHLSRQDRVAEVRMFGPFDDASKANVWAQRELYLDGERAYKVVDLNATLL